MGQITDDVFKKIKNGAELTITDVVLDIGLIIMDCNVINGQEIIKTCEEYVRLFVKQIEREQLNYHVARFPRDSFYQERLFKKYYK